MSEILGYLGWSTPGYSRHVKILRQGIKDCRRRIEQRSRRRASTTVVAADGSGSAHLSVHPIRDPYLSMQNREPPSRTYESVSFERTQPQSADPPADPQNASYNRPTDLATYGAEQVAPPQSNSNQYIFKGDYYDGGRPESNAPYGCALETSPASLSPLLPHPGDHREISSPYSSMLNLAPPPVQYQGPPLGSLHLALLYTSLSSRPST